VSAVSRRLPDAAPSVIVSVVNAVLYENVHNRMEQGDHVTLTLLCYDHSGRLVCAGAHEVLLICRAEDGRIDWIETPGTWVALVPDVRDVTPDTAFELRKGDLLVLYTDGITEARNAQGEMFGPDRLAAAVKRVRHEPVEKIRDTVLGAVEVWMARQEDDLSLFVARHHGVASSSA
jgi:phosphoserine phosphatase RsbU/P